MCHQVCLRLCDCVCMCVCVLFIRGSVCVCRVCLRGVRPHGEGTALPFLYADSPAPHGSVSKTHCHAQRLPAFQQPIKHAVNHYSAAYRHRGKTYQSLSRKTHVCLSVCPDATLTKMNACVTVRVFDIQTYKCWYQSVKSLCVSLWSFFVCVCFSFVLTLWVVFCLSQ